MTTMLVEVHWIDSSTKYGWYDSSDARLSDEGVTIKSFGHVCDENDDYITISTSKSGFGCYVDPLTIPKFAIIGLWEIELRR